MLRREFISQLERSAAGVICAGFALPLMNAGCMGYRYVTYSRSGELLVVRRADFGTEDYALLENPQLPRAIYLHRWPDGRFTAVLTRCSHRGCEVEPAGDRLACPCHGSEYTLTGDVLQGPAERALYSYEVSSDDENIYVRLPDPELLEVTS